MLLPRLTCVYSLDVTRGKKKHGRETHGGSADGDGGLDGGGNGGNESCKQEGLTDVVGEGGGRWEEDLAAVSGGAILSHNVKKTLPGGQAH